LPKVASARSSVLLILGATVLSGVSGYLVTWHVARTVGPSSYATFAIFWSALYLIVGVLFGLQQEAAQATAATAAIEQHREFGAAPAVRRASIARFAVLLSLVVVAVVLASSVLWAVPSLGVSHTALVWPIVIGAGFNCLVAAASGVMAGSEMWRHLAAIVAIDGVLRVGGVFLVLGSGGGIETLAWVVIAPFPLALALVFFSAPRRILRSARVSLGYRSLVRQTGQTLLAASATAVLINGFPLILSFYASDTNKNQLGSLILAITLTRAPILVPLMALQSYLVTRFSLRPEAVMGLIVRLLIGIAVLIGLLAFATLLWGTQLMGLFFGAAYALAPAVLVPLVASSGLIGALCVSGPAVLACHRHGAYALGWVVASGCAILVLFIPIPLDNRAALALAVGPLGGLIVHIGFLVGQKVAIPGNQVDSAPRR
jgi:O-antigen/teichoic acid export membrane protein